MKKPRTYRGFEIRSYRYQGCLNYKVPALGGSIAANLKTAKRWIDVALAAGELKRRQP